MRQATSVPRDRYEDYLATRRRKHGSNAREVGLGINPKLPVLVSAVHPKVVGVPKNVVAGRTPGARSSPAASSSSRRAGPVLSPHPAPVSPTASGCTASACVGNPEAVSGAGKRAGRQGPGTEQRAGEERAASPRVLVRVADALSRQQPVTLERDLGGRQSG